MQTRLISGNRDTLLFSINSWSLEYPSLPFFWGSPIFLNPCMSPGRCALIQFVPSPCCVAGCRWLSPCACGHQGSLYNVHRFLEHFPLGSFHTVHSILMPPPLFRSFLWNPNISHPRYLLLSDYIVVGG